jgi:hypothetical protein
MKRQFAASILIVLVVAACASSGYAAASQDYHARAVQYTRAGATVQNMRGVGRVSDAQWSLFQSAAAQVRAADSDVYADLAAWRDHGTKPPGFDANTKRLNDAQNIVIALAQEVSL